MNSRDQKRCRTEFLGVAFDVMDSAQVVEAISNRPAAERFASVVTPNVDHVVRLNREGGDLNALYRSAWLCVNDSKILSILARMSGLRLPTAPGSDITQCLLDDGHIRPETPICIVGGSTSMIEALKRRYGLETIDHIDAPMGLAHNSDARDKIVRQIEAGQYAVTFLAVGSPQQEMIASQLQRRGLAQGVGLCVGAGLNFAAGIQKRAPTWMRKLALEWAFRLGSEPKRLASRYLIDNPRIFGIWAKAMVSGRAVATFPEGDKSRPS